MIKGEALTHVGMVRKLNEDFFILCPDENLFLLADGMGGHNAGEVASKMALESVEKFIRESRRNDDMTWPFQPDPEWPTEANRLAVGVRLANRTVFEAARQMNALKGMGTTIVALLFNDKEAYISHLGDSRAYCIRSGTITQVTEDHSLVNEQVKSGQITPEEAKTSPYRNVITRAVGIKDDVETPILNVTAKPGDVFVMCSDGLTGFLSDEEILESVQAYYPALDGACRDLVARANERGGEDNITVVLAGVDLEKV